MPRLLRTVARTAVIAGTATTVSNRVSRGWCAWVGVGGPTGVPDRGQPKIFAFSAANSSSVSVPSACSLPSWVSISILSGAA